MIVLSIFMIAESIHIHTYLRVLTHVHVIILDHWVIFKHDVALFAEKEEVEKKDRNDEHDIYDQTTFDFWKH